MFLSIIQLVGIFILGWFGLVNLLGLINEENVHPLAYILAAIGLVMLCSGKIF